MAQNANADLLTLFVAEGLQTLKGWPRVERPCETEEVSWVCVDSVVEQLICEYHITSLVPVVQGGKLQAFQSGFCRAGGGALSQI